MATQYLPAEQQRYRPLNYLSYPTAIGPTGDVSLRIALHRGGIPVDVDLRVELVRATRYSDTGTYAIKPKRGWEQTVLPRGIFHLEAHGGRDHRSQTAGTVTVTAVVEAGAKSDLVAGFLLTRPNLRFVPPPQGSLEVREPHIVLPGVNQRFREYTLMRLLDRQPGQVDVWTRCATIEAETAELWLDQLLGRMDDIGMAQSEHAETVRALADELRAAKAKQPRFVKRALAAAVLGIIAKLAVLVVDPLLVVMAPEIQQVIIEANRFLERFF